MFGKITLQFETPSAYLDSIKVSSAFIFASSCIFEKREFEEICEKLRKGEIKFSSVFPLGYLPKPRIHISSEDFEKILGDKKKAYKQCRFLPENIVIRVLKNNSQEEYLEHVKEFLESEEEKEISKTEIRIRNSLRGEKNETEVFYLTLEKFFKANIYFQCEKDELKIIKSVFKFLENLGLSGKMSSGLGKCKIKKINYENSENFPKKLLLSKCLVTGERFKGYLEIDEINLRLKNGKILPQIPVILEGSVFEIPPKGSIIETKDYLTSCYGIYYGGEI